VVGELWQRDVELGGKAADRGRSAVPEPVDDAQPERVGELLEQRDARVRSLTLL
jgi:hypothetical protein